ncbi:DUF1631 domain-containing protein [Dokdonella immobilis]|uniref:Thymidine phosphorylase n=1 Tax=Dokdonella immobilis TaxID=578942 RepID=A0A1I4Y4L3_9GAMM|nr:DUF1631 domain-containing protein [Dokdonella immobilis]SFN32633.1 Protein of unknown function [Dokdonella immobilis]
MKQAGKGSAEKADGKPRLVRLAERALPKRVRFLLDGLQERTAYFEASLSLLFDEVEQRLFKLADCARSNEEQARLFEAIREIKRGKSDIVPRFLSHLESSLAQIDKGPVADTQTGAGRDNRGTTKLELVDSRDLEISLAMQDIGNRAEIRHSTALHMLGHRLGVIAGRPAFEPAELPLGPLALARALQHALSDLDIDLGERVRVFHDFDTIVMGPIDQFYERLNQYLAEQGVLPNLQFHSRRAGPADNGDVRKATNAERQDEAEEPASAGDPYSARGGAAPATRGPSRGPSAAGAGSGPRQAAPGRYSPGPAPAAAASAAEPGDSQLFASLRGLLAERRRSLDIAPAAPASGYMASRDDLQSVLGALQSNPIETYQQNGRAVPRGIGHLKQDLLNQLREKSPEGQTPLLAEEDSDTIDLVGMLFDYIGQNLASHSSSRELIAKLQVPVLRSAISDKHFFTQRNHPARQLLNSVAEATQLWMGDDETDSGMVDTMTSMVDRVTNEFDGDLSLMEKLLDDLGKYMSQVTRRAEIAERRHIDAAKGRERLDLSREQANAAVARLLKRGKPAPMVRAVLEQAWTDVLALTLLRQGEDSQAYRRCLAVADQLMQIGSGSDLAKVDQTVREEVRNGLLQVGLHGDEVEGVVSKLFDPSSVEKKTSHTELAHALKSKTRLGGDAASAGKAAAESAGDTPAPALTGAEKEMVQRIRTLPFGTWFEFVTNQQGSVVRRKLAWFSTVTGRCLFVNQRGARSEEKTIEQLARDLVRGQVRLFKEESGSIIDRAWKAIMSKLQQYSGQPGLPASA